MTKLYNMSTNHNKLSESVFREPIDKHEIKTAFSSIKAHDFNIYTETQ